MKTNMFNTEKLSEVELVDTNGGSEQTYQNGVEHGKAIKQFISDTADTIANWWNNL